MKHLRASLSTGFILILVACGGATRNDTSQTSNTPSSQVSPEEVVSISGTAATGLAIAGGTLVARCKNGAATAVTDNDGTFVFKIPSGASKPCLIKVESGTTALYSAASETQTVANVTPLTNLIVANALGDDPSKAFDAAASGTPPAALNEKNIRSAKTVVAAAMNSIGVSLPSDKDPMSTSFKAATNTGAGDALDATLDKLMLTLSNSNVSIENLSSALKTATPTDAGSKLQTAAKTGETIVPYVEKPYTVVPNDAVEVSLAGNGYITKAVNKATDKVDHTTNAINGLLNWASADAVASVFVYIKNPGLLEIGVDGKLENAGSSVIKVSARGKSFNVTLNSTEQQKIPAGVVAITAPGYIKIDLKGVSKTTATYANIKNLQLSGSASVGMTYAKTPDSAASTGYYWMRRGTSTYLRYNPTAKNYQYFYNEATVPAGFDPLSSYFAINGFSKGYFGIQVKETERWVIFSVWDRADCDRTTTPIDTTKCTSLVSYGPGVVAKTFGGEGTGGQSYLVYPWITGNTYKFVTRAEIVGNDTLFSSWFYAPEDAQWHYMATFKYPGEALPMTGLFTFDECFSPAHSYMPRKVITSNQWGSADGVNWSEMTQATYDATTEQKERIDVAGGLINQPSGGSGNAFYLLMGGFFNNDGSFNPILTSQNQVNPTPAIKLTRAPSGNLNSAALQAIVPLLTRP